MEPVVSFANGIVRGAGVKPHVHNVLFFDKLGTAALFALCVVRNKLGGVCCVPGVGTVFGKNVRNFINGFVIDKLVTAVLAIENRQRNAPLSLTGDAPVVSVLNHFFNSVLAPLRVPGNALYCLDGVFFKSVNRCKPLLGRSENNRVAAAPAMGVLVDDWLDFDK